MSPRALRYSGFSRMQIENPQTAGQTAEVLAASAAANRTIHAGGAFSKIRMGGPVPASDVTVSTVGLSRVLQYEPRDLTISVEAGLPWSELTRILAGNRQMIPLDPPFFEHATVGGVIAANTSGPRRRLYGTARDVVIGMQFATLEGKLIQSGGMVVKNVAGLDMGKLMIGSFGTLAVITVINFKLAPVPPATRTLLFQVESAEKAFVTRDAILRGVLQPSALDLLNPGAAARIGLNGWCLLVQAGGNEKMLDRYSRELPAAEIIDEGIWKRIREFTPAFLAENPNGAVCRLSATLMGLKETMPRLGAPAVARAGSGVTYVHYTDATQATGLVDYRPANGALGREQWPDPPSGFDTMRRIKQMFDTRNLLNPGRLYGRI